jgi:prepilin-type N-terminal cleavage/methylation domain-containing protein
MTMKTSTQPSAFTLIETLIAITIITIAIVGPMTAASRAIVAAQTARDQLTASYLAQEGVEYVRAVRDDAYLTRYLLGDTTGAWSDFTTSGALSNCVSGVCALGALHSESPGGTNAVTPCSDNECSAEPILLGGTGTAFTRTIQLELDVSGNDAAVTSQVSWNFHGAPYTVTITNHLTPWQ